MRTPLDQAGIEKIDSCLNKNFISSMAITVKTEGSIELALDSKVVNKTILKNKYKKCNIDSLILLNSPSLIVNGEQNDSSSTTIDLKFGYSQLNLHPKIHATAILAS